MFGRKTCLYCTRKHVSCARRIWAELPRHADQEDDPHLEDFLAELDEAEAQVKNKYPQVAERLHGIRKLFDELDIWCFNEIWIEAAFDVDEDLVKILFELRELRQMERLGEAEVKAAAKVKNKTK